LFTHRSSSKFFEHGLNRSGRIVAINREDLHRAVVDEQDKPALLEIGGADLGDGISEELLDIAVTSPLGFRLIDAQVVNRQVFTALGAIAEAYAQEPWTVVPKPDIKEMQLIGKDRLTRQRVETQ